MDVPTNIRIFLDSLRGSTKPLSREDFSEEEQRALRIAIERAKQRNADQEFRLKNNQYITPQEYRLNPETALKPNGKPGSYSSQPVPYTEYQDNLKRGLESFDRTRGKTSVSYGDYNTKSGENAAPVGQNWISAIKQSIDDPAFRMAGTLGSFNAYDEPNGMRIEDQYGFDKGQEWFYRNAPEKGLLDIFKQYGTQPGALGEILFRKYRGDSSRPVNIKLDK